MTAVAPDTSLPEPAKSNRYRTLLLFGAPGTGKGTMGRALGSIPGFVHCSCGDVFRTLDYSSPLGRAFSEYSSKGLLVPDDMTIALWRQSLEGMVAANRFVPERDYLVLDGIPRNIEQARIMDAYISVERIFYLECSNREMMAERMRRRALKENRIDDASDEVIRRRWDVYEAESKPVLEHYPADLVEHVDALGTPVQVLHDILSRLIRGLKL